MRRKVYRALDRPSAFFGIRGRYTTWLAMLLGVALVLAFFVAALTVRIVGYITFGAGAVAAYLYIISLQERLSDRQLDKRMDARRIPSCVRRTPGPVRRLWSETEKGQDIGR